MAIQDQITAYKATVNNDVSTQTDPDSIAPDVVGAIGTDLADILLPELLKINLFGIGGGTGVPTGGQIKDLYFKSELNNIAIYRNLNGTWTLLANIPLGVNYIDGIITGLRTSLTGSIVTVTPGSWAISNAIYSKSTQTQITLDPKDLSFDRWDLIYADTSGNINYLAGTPTLVPVKPTIPASTILVDYAYVPSVGSPYLISGQTTSSGLTPYSQSDLTADGNGGFMLPIGLIGDQAPATIMIDYDFTTSGGNTGTKNLTPIYADGYLYGFEDPALGTQLIKVKTI